MTNRRLRGSGQIGKVQLFEQHKQVSQELVRVLEHAPNQSNIESHVSQKPPPPPPTTQCVSSTAYLKHSPMHTLHSPTVPYSSNWLSHPPLTIPGTLGTVSLLYTNESLKLKPPPALMRPHPRILCPYSASPKSPSLPTVQTPFTVFSQLPHHLPMSTQLPATRSPL